MRYWAYSLFWYMIPKSSTTRVNVILFLLWHHNPGVIGAGSYHNGRRFSFSAVCAMMPAWTRPHINFYTLT